MVSFFIFRICIFQVMLNTDDRPATAFSTRDLDLPHTHFELTVMPQGATNSALNLQRTLKYIFQDICTNNVTFYLDNIYIYGENFDKINDALIQVLRTAVSHYFLSNLQKSSFGLSEVYCLGFVITHGKVKPNPNKIKA